MQVISGPRQVGKTTMVLQVLERCGRPHHYATADSPVLQTSIWVSPTVEPGQGPLPR